MLTQQNVELIYYNRLVLFQPNVVMVIRIVIFDFIINNFFSYRAKMLKISRKKCLDIKL